MAGTEIDMKMFLVLEACVQERVIQEIRRDAEEWLMRHIPTTVGPVASIVVRVENARKIEPNHYAHYVGEVCLMDDEEVVIMGSFPIDPNDPVGRMSRYIYMKEDGSLDWHYGNVLRYADRPEWTPVWREGSEPIP